MRSDLQNDVQPVNSAAHVTIQHTPAGLLGGIRVALINTNHAMMEAISSHVTPSSVMSNRLCRDLRVPVSTKWILDTHLVGWKDTISVNRHSHYVDTPFNDEYIQTKDNMVGSDELYDALCRERKCVWWWPFCTLSRE